MKQRLRLVLQEFLLGNEGLDGNHVVERVNHLLDKLREYIQLNRDTKIEAMYIQITDTEKVTVFNDHHRRPLADTEASCQPQSTLTSYSNFHHQQRPAENNVPSSDVTPPQAQLSSLPLLPDPEQGPGRFIDNNMVTAECDNMDEAASHVSLTNIGNNQVIIVELCRNELMI